MNIEFSSFNDVTVDGTPFSGNLFDAVKDADEATFKKVLSDYAVAADDNVRSSLARVVSDLDVANKKLAMSVSGESVHMAVRQRLLKRDAECKRELDKLEQNLRTEFRRERDAFQAELTRLQEEPTRLRDDHNMRMEDLEKKHSHAMRAEADKHARS